MRPTGRLESLAGDASTGQSLQVAGRPSNCHVSPLEICNKLHSTRLDSTRLIYRHFDDDAADADHLSRRRDRRSKLSARDSESSPGRPKWTEGDT